MLKVMAMAVWLLIRIIGAYRHHLSISRYLYAIDSLQMPVAYKYNANETIGPIVKGTGK